MENNLREIGIKQIGKVPWGTHFCQFYHTKNDLLSILVPYFTKGLENNEFCMWVTSEPLTVNDCKKAMEKAMPGFDTCLKRGQIEIIDYKDWYVKDSKFEAKRVLDGWVKKQKQALKNGFDGLRLTGNTFWLEKKDWKAFNDYEKVVNDCIGRYKMLAICTYSLKQCSVSEVLDVINTHQFGLIKRDNEWRIIERLESKEALGKFKWLASFPEINPNPIVETDLMGNISYLNPSAEKIFPDLKTKGNKHAYLTGINSLFGKLKDSKKKYLIRKIKAGNLWLNQMIHYIADTKRLRIYSSNINEIMKLEEALRKSELAFRAVAETAKDAIISANAQGNIIHFNKGAEHVFGYKSNEVLNKPLTLLMPERFRQAHRHGMSRFLAHGNPHVIGKTIEITGRKKNGTEFPLELSLASWKVGREIFFTAIIRDITKRKILEQNKDDFIAIAGHELRTPIASIKIINQVLTEMFMNNPEAKKYLNKTADQLDILVGLINDLLNVQKMQTGKMGINKQHFCPQELIEDVAQDMQKTTKKHQILVNGAITDTINADEERVRQVLVNLFSNAIKFSPNGGKIIADLKTGKRKISVGITDYGVGIPKKHRERIFDRFYRVYGSGNKMYPGLGMGLYLSYQIIKSHNGDMWFKSAPNKGSTFYFSLPISKI